MFNIPKFSSALIVVVAVIGIYPVVSSQDMTSSASGIIQATAFVAQPAGLVRLTEFTNWNKAATFEKLVNEMSVTLSTESAGLPADFFVYHPPYYNDRPLNSALLSLRTDSDAFSYSISVPFLTSERTHNQLIATLIYTEN